MLNYTEVYGLTANVDEIRKILRFQSLLYASIIYAGTFNVFLSVPVKRPSMSKPLHKNEGYVL